LSAQFSRGRCTITDNSTNGSWVIPDKGDRHQVKRETFPLKNSGLLVMGNPDEVVEADAIRYECY
jgi:hypothetical protein